MIFKGIRHDELKWNNDNKYRVLDEKMTVDIDFTMEHNEVTYHTKFVFEPSFRCAGMAMPFFCKFLLPTWSKNETYNVAAFVLNSLYAEKGFFLLSRNECDELIRNIIASTIKNPIKRWVVCQLVDFFLAYNIGWGFDDDDNDQLSNMEIRASYDD